MDKIRKFFDKISEFIKRMFKKDNVMLLQEPKIEEFRYNDNFVEDKNTQNEKQEFFELYENVKNGKINVENFMINDLIKVLTMLQNELSIFDKKINNVENESISFEKELRILQEENKRLTKVM